MPRNPDKRPYRIHEHEIISACQDLDSGVTQSAHPFAAAAYEGRLLPSEPLDALSLAFAAATHELLLAREARIDREQPTARQRSRTVTADLAKDLGMSAQTLRETRDGDRWVTLADVLAGLGRRHDFAPVFERHLGALLRPWPYLLHKDAPEHPTPSPPRALEATADQHDSVVNVDGSRRLTEADVLNTEHQAREAIAALAAAQARTERAGRALPSSVDWMAVAASLHPLDSQPRTDERADAEPERPRPGMQTPGAKTPADYGIDNVNEAVRNVFTDGKPHAAAEVIAHVQQVAKRNQIEGGLEIEPLPTDMIRSALWRLHSQPKSLAKRWLTHDGKTYSPGSRMLKELEEKGTTKKP